MKTKPYTNEQILAFLCQADLGVAVKDLCKQHGFSERTYQRWRTRMAAGRCSLAQRLLDLESENARLWRLLGGPAGADDADTSPLQWPDILPPDEDRPAASDHALPH